LRVRPASHEQRQEQEDRRRWPDVRRIPQDRETDPEKPIGKVGEDRASHRALEDCDGRDPAVQAHDDGYEAAVDCAVDDISSKDGQQHVRKAVDREPDGATRQLVGSTGRAG
jgi:hypothetical protein